MYKLWIGLQPRFTLHIVHGALSIGVLYMHLWAFGAMGWPKSISQKYPQYTAAAPAATP
jgi:hypothetical protein